MNIKKNHEFMERLRCIFRIALPLIIQGLVFQLQNLTDKGFLGNQDTRYVSAVGAAQMPYLATVSCLVAMNTGLIIIVARKFGAKKEGEIAAFVKSSIFYNLLLGIGVFFLWFFWVRPILSFFQIDSTVIHYSIDYIRICSIYLLVVGVDSSLQAMLHGMGETKPIMYSGFIKVGLNVVLSWVLIFGKFGFPALSVNGAAIGTVVANLVSFVYLLLYCFVYQKKKYLLGIWNREWFQIRSYLKVVRLGIPVGLEYLLWNFSNLILIRFINGFSFQDMAIYSFAFGMQCIVYVIFEGTSKAALTLIGQNIGAGNEKEANRFFYTSILVNFTIVSIACVCFLFFAKPILDLFSNDSYVILNGAPYLKLIGIIMFPQSMTIICANAIRANGNTKWMLLTQALGSVIVISVSYLLIKVLHMNMVAIYITLFLDELIRGVINLLYYRKKYGVVN